MTWVTVGTAAAVGAGVGAGSQLLQGKGLDEALQGALLGGAMGAVTGGAGAALGGATAGGSSGLTTELVAEAAPELVQTAAVNSAPLDTVIQQATPELLNQTATAVPTAGIDQVANYNVSGALSDVGTNPDYTAWKNAIDSGQYVPNQTLSPEVLQATGNAPTGSYTPTQLNDIARGQGVFPEGSIALPGSEPTGIASFSAPPPPSSGGSGFMDGFSKFTKDHPFITGAGIYGVASATGMLKQNQQTFGQQSNQTTFNNPYKFDAKNFKGSHPDPSKYWYTPKGPGYADGGITQASSPVPGMMQSGPADVNFMGDDMFPQSQQSYSLYATPTQMPTSAQQSAANYEPKTNPLTGEMTANLASGGIAGYAQGGRTNYGFSPFDDGSGFSSGFGQSSGMDKPYESDPNLSPLDNLMAKYNYTGEMPTQDEYLGTMGLHTSFNPEYYFDKQNTKFVPVSSVPSMQDAGLAPAPAPTADSWSSGGGGGYAGGSMPDELKYASGGIARYRNQGLATSTGGRGDVYSATQRFLDMYDPESKYQAPSGSVDVGIFHDTNTNTRDKSALEASQIRQKAIAKKANVKTGANYAAPSRQMGQLDFSLPNAKADKDSDSDSVLAARGGIMGASLGGYAAGGNPRLLRGPGDGMSDNIPATIGGRQPARLADGEFVVPADVVSHLGNGSTEAGAKKLHQMMDKVRVDRTGKKKQAPAVKANKYIPK